MRLYNQDYSIDISPRPDGTHSMRFGPPPRFEPTPDPATWQKRFCWALAVLIYPFYLTVFVLALVIGLAAVSFDPRFWFLCCYCLDKVVGRIAKRIGAEPPEAPE